MGCNCGYWWEDLNDYGEPISLAYCHYVGPEEWAPCAQDDYEEEPIFEEYGAPFMITRSFRRHQWEQIIMWYQIDQALKNLFI